MSDHISGPRALAEPIADITDVYAFPSPERDGWLVLVMNTLPFAGPEARFSEGLVYRFRLRPADVPFAGNGAGPTSAHGKGNGILVAEGAAEWVFDCLFERPDDAGRQAGRCTGPGGRTVDVAVGDERGAEASGSAGLRFFAGPRWDPFIMDARAGLRTIAEGRPMFTDPGSIYLDGKNVLGLVVEVDCAAAFGTLGPMAVVAETLTRGLFSVRIERVGRPEVKNLLLGPRQFDTVNRDLEIRDLYNMEDAFHLGDSYANAYRARLNANLAFWDGLDGQVAWPVAPDGTHPLTELLLADYLVVDPSKPYAETGSFLEIETSVRAGRPHRTCGGRALNDDVIDTLYTLWINGGAGPVIRDGVDAATRPGSTRFPYLASPNAHPPSVPAHV